MKERPSARERVLHIRVDDGTAERVADMATAEDRKVSSMGAILLSEAIEARAPRKRRRVK